MARRRSKRPIVPGAEQGLNWLKTQVMKDEGYVVDPAQPDKVKYEVARTLGIPLNQGYNGSLSTESAGKIGGKIGGSMVREMVKMAQQQLTRGDKHVTRGR